MSKLAAAATTPGVESALVGQCDRVRIATRYLHDLDCLQQVDKSGRWLVRIALNIGRQVTHRGQAQLSASTGTPGVDIALDIDCDGVTIATRNLINALVPQLFYLKWVGLKRIAVAILGHLTYDSAAVAELTHLTTTPSVQAAFLVGVTAIIL